MYKPTFKTSRDTLQIITKTKEQFLELDLDGDGCISTHELDRGLHSLRKKIELSEGNIKLISKELHRDGNGNVDLE